MVGAADVDRGPPDEVLAGVAHLVSLGHFFWGFNRRVAMNLPHPGLWWALLYNAQTLESSPRVLVSATADMSPETRPSLTCPVKCHLESCEQTKPNLAPSLTSLAVTSRVTLVSLLLASWEHCQFLPHTECLARPTVPNLVPSPLIFAQLSAQTFATAFISLTTLNDPFFLGGNVKPPTPQAIAQVANPAQVFCQIHFLLALFGQVIAQVRRR